MPNHLQSESSSELVHVYLVIRGCRNQKPTQAPINALFELFRSALSSLYKSKTADETRLKKREKQEDQICDIL